MSGRVLSAAGCSQCRSSLLRLFIATPTIPLGRTFSHLTAAPWRTATATSRITRSYSSTPEGFGLSDLQGSKDSSAQLERLGAESANQTSGASESVSASEDTPWYLQVDPPRNLPVSEPPPLPDVPEGSPPIIPALLKYASEEMGLDDLSLLDLRELDPPPALGANLFMLFGTARSERHLNVSAGRLVRWLRAKHRVNADADGLLGPNERKTKLKRKAKRAKLLGTMGTDETDDGITTGWVCVNLGTINRSHMESAVVAEDGRVAGFGVPQTGTTIVVQVMSEARRAELALETLWERALARQLKEQAKELGSDTPNAHDLGQAVLSQTRPRPTLENRSPGASTFANQSRSFSTQTDRISDIDQPAMAAGDPSTNSTGDHLSYSNLFNIFGTSSTSEISDKLLHDVPSKLQVLELLQSYLGALQAADAFATLKSTTFRKISRIAMDGLPKEQTWSLRLAIEFEARRLGLEDHHSLDITRQLVNELRILAISASRENILQLLGCIYATPGPELHEQSRLAMELLESVHTRGELVVANDVVVSIMESLSWSSSPTQEARELQASLEDLMIQAKLPYMGESLLIRLMDVYARLSRWDQLWEAWRIPPRYAQPRSKAMYLHVLKVAAATSNPVVCTEAVHRCFQEMILENPLVEPVGEVRNALLQCVRVADPKAEEHADILSSSARGVAKALVNRDMVRLVKEVKMLRPTQSHPRA